MTCFLRRRAVCVLPRTGREVASIGETTMLQKHFVSQRLFTRTNDKISKTNQYDQSRINHRNEVATAEHKFNERSTLAGNSPHLRSYSLRSISAIGCAIRLTA